MNRRDFFGYGLLLGATSLLSMKDLKTFSLNSALGAGVVGSNKRVVYIFLRGGADFISILPPENLADINKYRNGILKDDNYTAFGPGKNAAFRYHNNLAPISDLLKEAALITHTASLNKSRSHFFQQDIIENGSSEKVSDKGFLAKAFENKKAVALGQFLPRSLNGKDSLVVNDLEEIKGSIIGGSLSSPIERERRLSLLKRARNVGSDGACDSDYICNKVNAAKNEYQDLATKMAGATSAVYSDSSLQSKNFVNHMNLAAQVLNSGYGANVVTVEFRAWDTHINQTGEIAKKTSALAEGIKQFHNTLTDKANTTIVVMSEFGRTIKMNPDGGTDHGAGSMMLVLGGGLNPNFVSPAWDLSSFCGLSDVNDTPANAGTSAALLKKYDYRLIMDEILNKNYAIPSTQAFDGSYVQPATFLNFMAGSKRA